MEISNFRDLAQTGETLTERRFHAKVDVKKWWWLKPKTVSVSKDAGCYWYFTETGEWCPGRYVEALERAYLARQALENA